MQIHNFYSDPVPSVRNPLDSIVLSPHTLRTDHISLTGMDEDSSDYQSLLPSIRSCELHDQDTCIESNPLPRYIWDRFRHILRGCGRRKVLNHADLDL